MSSDRVEDTIIDLLRLRFCGARSKLSPASRIVQDLRIDGDDAAELIDTLHRSYGTDFTALGQTWHNHFNPEGIGGWSSLAGLLWMLPTTFVTTVIAIQFGLSERTGGILGVVVFFSSALLLGQFVPKQKLQPVTVAALAEAIRAGAWPNISSTVKADSA